MELAEKLQKVQLEKEALAKHNQSLEKALAEAGKAVIPQEPPKVRPSTSIPLPSNEMQPNSQAPATPSVSRTHHICGNVRCFSACMWL